VSGTASPNAKMAGVGSTLMFVVTIVLVLLALWRDNGWGPMVWLLAFVAMTLIRMPHHRAAKTSAVAKSQVDTTEKLLLGGLFLTMMALPLLQLATGIFDFANYQLPTGTTAVGALLQVPFLWLFWRSHTDLGENWSPSLEVRKRHGLVTHGVYARIRHPMYLAIWLSAIAQPLLIQNWIAGLLVMPAFAAMYVIRVPNEEAMMRDLFGADYDAYCARSGRIFPKVLR